MSIEFEQLGSFLWKAFLEKFGKYMDSFFKQTWNGYFEKLENIIWKNIGIFLPAAWKAFLRKEVLIAFFDES